jgi:UDP-N-acetylmuramyl tripeptide synthase
VAGLVAEMISPQILAHLIAQVPLGSVFVTGTNGKTTTTRMIAHIMRRYGWEPLHNRSGSNLTRGLLTTLLNNATSDGRLLSRPESVGLFEVDEAVLPLVLQQAPARVIALLNLFRDQLDRYGEVDSIAEAWRQILRQMGRETILVLNADDPLVASLGDGFAGKVLYFGLEDVGVGRPRLSHASDSKWCYRCGQEYAYSVSYFGHIGHYWCAHCGTSRPRPQVVAKSIRLDGFARTQYQLVMPSGERQVDLSLPGLYNVYNALAAAAVAEALDIPPATVADSLAAFTAAFGRMERVGVEGRTVYLVLAKNPVGFNEVLSALLADKMPKNVLLVLNDRIADGRDVSWIWDVDFELLAGEVRYVLTSGLRAADMALRLKYAGVGAREDGDADDENGTSERNRHGAEAFSVDAPAACQAPALQAIPDLGRALDTALEHVRAGDTLYVLTTYTAMLEMRSLLAKRGYLRQHWEEE